MGVRKFLKVLKNYKKLTHLLADHFYKRNMCIGNGCYFEECGIWLKESDILFLKDLGILKDERSTDNNKI